MYLRKLTFVIAVAALMSAGIAHWSTSLPFAHNLIRIQTERKLAAIDKRIVDAPLETQALLLDYAGDDDIDAKSPHGELVLTAWIAFSKYPKQSPEVFRLYGSDPAFQKILRNYGEIVVPIIKYFLDNDVISLHVVNSVNNALQNTTQVVQNTKDALKKFLGMDQENPPPQPPESPRVLRRLQHLRRWSHEKVNKVFPRSPRTRCAHGARASRRISLPVGSH